MIILRATLVAAAAALLAVLSTASASAGKTTCAVTHHTGPVPVSGPVAPGTVLEINPILLAGSNVSGTFKLTITGGRTISETGKFSVAAGSKTSLGTIKLPIDNSAYDVKLKIKWPGGSASCERHLMSQFGCNNNGCRYINAEGNVVTKDFPPMGRPRLRPAKSVAIPIVQE
jgi:hypothetical protein